MAAIVDGGRRDLEVRSTDAVYESASGQVPVQFQIVTMRRTVYAYVGLKPGDLKDLSMATRTPYVGYSRRNPIPKAC